MELVSENKYRAYPKTSFNLIIAANITTPKYDVSLISYIGILSCRLYPASDREHLSMYNPS